MDRRHGGRTIIYYVVIKSTVQLCGNGVRDGGEQCDDGNSTNLDGCDADCRFDQAQRAVWFKMQFSTDTVCTQNALGRAFAGAAVRNSLQSEIDSRVGTGAFSLVLPALDASDVSGTNDPSFELGFLTASPEPGGGYHGTNDLDWWHVIDPATLTPAREPLFLLPASITNSALVAGPGAAVLPQVFMAGGPLLRLALARLSISVGPTSTPLVSASGDPPGHLVSENLDPSLTCYATCGSPNATASGHLCGNMTARSLAQTPIVQGLVGCGLFTCTQCYTAANTMLDVIVGGCAISMLGNQILATHPDASDPAAPIAGAGAPYQLVWSTTTKSVVGCRDRNNQTVDLNTCLDSAAYSSFFRLATNRVIPK